MKTVLLNKWHLSLLGHTASTVFIFAGGSASGRISNTWTIDFDTETWTAGPDMMVTRDVHVSVSKSMVHVLAILPEALPPANMNTVEEV